MPAKISDFSTAGVLTGSETVTGLQAGGNKNFPHPLNELVFTASGKGAALVSFDASQHDTVGRVGGALVARGISATDSPYSATGDGVTDDTAALNAFLAAADIGYIPAGTYKITGQLNFRSNQTILGTGPGTVLAYAAVAPVASEPVLNISGKAHVKVANLQVQVDPATYTTARTLLLENSSYSSFSDILLTGGGGNAAYVTGCVECSVNRVVVDDYRSNGFYVSGSTSCTIDGISIADGSGGLMGVQVVSGSRNVVKNCHIAKTPNNYFGIHGYGCSFLEIHNNEIKNTFREAIAVGGTSNHGARITNNTLEWTENLGTGDFGMSIAGEDANNIIGDFLIDGNTIIGSSYDAIGIAGWCQRGLVTNNIIRDCCQAGLVTHQSGIKLYGWVAGAVVDDITVCDNTISKVSSGSMLYGVTESNGLGTASRNIIRNNKVYGLTGALYSVEASTSVTSLNHDDLLGKSFTSTVTASAGTITTATGTLTYQIVGKFALCLLQVTITTNGTGSSQVRASLPFTISGGVLSGAESSINGKSIKAGIVAGGVSVGITNYDNTYPGADGAVLILSGILVLA